MPIHSPFLRYFDEVRRCGSIRQAARNLYVASSAVNRRILRMEAELGVRLFRRSPRGLQLTRAGERLAQHIERTLADAERTLREMHALAGEHPHHVTIAGQESVIAHFLPPALVALHAELPQVATAFKAAGGDAVQALLRAGEADVALAFDPPSAPDVRTVAACRLAVGALLAPAHPLAARERVSLHECARYPIVLPDESWPLRALLDRELERCALTPHVITSSNSVEFLRTMLDQQLGIGFQTVVGVEGKVERGELVHVPLASPAPIEQEFAICVRAEPEPPPALARLLALLSARLAEYGTLG